ncbi:MAG: nucleotidyltransferase domain-containing protein [bacterium]
MIKKFPDTEVILFGSKARGDSEKYSDIDLLILLNRAVNTAIEEEVRELTYDIVCCFRRNRTFIQFKIAKKIKRLSLGGD